MVHYKDDRPSGVPWQKIVMKYLILTKVKSTDINNEFNWIGGKSDDMNKTVAKTGFFTALPVLKNNQM